MCVRKRASSSFYCMAGGHFGRAAFCCTPCRCLLGQGFIEIRIERESTRILIPVTLGVVKVTGIKTLRRTSFDICDKDAEVKPAATQTHTQGLLPKSLTSRPWCLLCKLASRFHSRL